jgi:RNA polymerase sigma-70 factor (ECF subfamily)
MDSVEQFEQHRGLMFAIAYRMLGSAMEAEDMVQEAYLRYQRVPPDTIQSHRAFLTTMVTRLCINALQSARASRETYIGPWLPEPLLTSESEIPPDSVHESISVAFLILLEKLTPVERAVFLLREVFDYDYAQIAEIVGKEEAACRQSFSRAKKHIAENRPRFKPTPDEHRQMLDQFMQAIGEGNLDGLVKMLAENVTLWADGGGKARGAATRPLHGSTVVAPFILATTRRLPENAQIEVKTLNGESAIVVRIGDNAIVAIFLKVEGKRIHEVWTIGNPDKLKRV